MNPKRHPNPVTAARNACIATMHRRDVGKGLDKLLKQHLLERLNDLPDDLKSSPEAKAAARDAVGVTDGELEQRIVDACHLMDAAAGELTVYGQFFGEDARPTFVGLYAVFVARAVKLEVAA